MKILVINKVGTNCIIDSNFIPRIDDKVDLFYEPFPTVINILAWPTVARLREVGIKEKIDVIITVE